MIVWERQLVGLQTGPCALRARRDWRKSQPTPDWQVTVFISKETCIGGLPQDEKVSVPAQLTLRSLHGGLNWVQSCILPRWSQRLLTLTRLCPQNSSHCGNSGQNKPSKGSERVRSLSLPRASSWVTQWSHPLNVILQHNWTLSSASSNLLPPLSPAYQERTYILLCSALFVPEKGVLWLLSATRDQVILPNSETTDLESHSPKPLFVIKVAFDFHLPHSLVCCFRTQKKEKQDITY